MPLIAILLWATSLLPEYLTALLFFAAVAVVHAAPPDVLFSGFQSEAFWLVLGGFVIGSAIRKVGLADRIARGLCRPSHRLLVADGGRRRCC